MIRHHWFAPTLLAATLPLAAASSQHFEERIRPLLQAHCYECHGDAEAKSGVNFEAMADERAYRSAAGLLEAMEWSISEHEMPTPEVTHPLPESDRAVLVTWLRETLADLRNAAPDDPGRVIMPRINHHEYDYVIRDLTGVGIDAARVFPRDSGGGEGFINVGEAQTETPMQVEKFLAAAKHVLSHARVSPINGLLWSSRARPPLTTDADRLPELKEAWLVWHTEQFHDQVKEPHARLREQLDMDVGTYFAALWRWRHREALGLDVASLAELAAAGEIPLQPVILERLHELLAQERLTPYLTLIRDEWLAIPASADPATVRAACRELDRRLKAFGRQDIDGRDGQWPALRAEEWPTWDRNDLKDSWKAAIEERATWGYTLRLERLDGIDQVYFAVSPAGDGSGGDVVRFHEALVARDERGEDTQPYRGRMRVVRGEAVGSTEASDELVVRAPAVIAVEVPEDGVFLHLAAQVTEAGREQGSVQISIFNDLDKVPEDLTRLPGRYVLGWPESEPRQALHRAFEQAEQVLDTPWLEGWMRGGQVFRAIPGVEATAVYDGDIPDYRGRWVRPMDLEPEDLRIHADAAASAELALLAEELRIALDPPARAVRDEMASTLIRDFAARAWRGPVSQHELDRLLALYHAVADERAYDSAVKLPLTAILVHPRFLYRLQSSRQSGEPYRLDPYDLAERLSFTLWGSLPDAELLAAAADGSLHEEPVLRAQVARMLADERARNMSHEFAGHWLGFVGFADYGEVSTERFEDFTPAVRQAMFEEIRRFTDEALRGARPASDLLDSDETWVNEALADIYGIPDVEGKEMRLVQLPADSRRGGVVTMGAVLTTTSKALRTSPVVRGAFVYEGVLGIHLPPPPDNVPMLSDDDVNADGLTFLEQLEQHRDSPDCRGCHAKLDPVGLSLENFDPIGRWRERDSADNPVTNRAELPNGEILDGITGLRGYLAEHEDRFRENLCEKFLAYALGRGIQVTDRPLIDHLVETLVANDDHFPAVIAEIVTSQQFTHRRDEVD